MIRRPPESSARRLREFLVGALPGTIAALILVCGAFFLYSSATRRLEQAQISAARVKAPVPEAVLDSYTNSVNQAQAALAEVITQRNDAIETIARLDTVAKALAPGARLVNYGQNANIQIEAVDERVLGDTARQWATAGFTVSVSTSALGQPGTRTTPAIEPNASFTLSDALLSPGPAATPAPVATPPVNIPGVTR